MQKYLIFMPLLVMLGITVLLPIQSVAESLKPIAEYEVEENIRLSEQIADQLPRESPVLKKLNQEIEYLKKKKISQNRSARGGELSPRIVNGVKTVSYPQVGALLHRNNNNIFGAHCTGTMIASDSFLTAAHCIAEDLDEKNYKVYFQNGGIFRVKKIAYLEQKYHFPKADVAVLKLTTKIDGIAPSLINNLFEIAAPSFGIIVGFGRTGGMKSDYGIKQIGTVKTTRCSSDLSKDNLICWRFERPVGNPGKDSNTCQGDSGGPLYALLNKKDYIVGITSGGKNKYCLDNDLSYDTSVFKFWKFIEKAANLSNARPISGPLPSVGTPYRTVVMAGSGNLSEDTQKATFEISLPPGVAKLRIALNGIDDGTNNFDLYVRHGKIATTGEYDYKSAELGQFEFCEINSPAQGNWNITVQRDSGRGAFQVVSTLFGN